MKLTSVLLLLVYYSYASAQSAPSIAEFEVSLASSQTLPLTENISLTISTNKIEALTETLSDYEKISTTILDNTSLKVEMNKRPRYKQDIGNNRQKYLADTFVIDYSQPSTNSFIEGFRNTAISYSSINPAYTRLSEFEAFVASYIDTPTYVNGFNIASVVASQRSGDCTEYAVLLAALMRAHDIPARVMLGTVLIDDGNTLRAVGHAWVEAWQNKQWHILDSALSPLVGATKYYLPAQALENEGLGFAMSVMQSVGLIPQKIAEVKSIN